MHTDATPDHVRLAGSLFSAVLKSRTAIRCPAQLPHPGGRSDPLDSQPRMKLLDIQPENEVGCEHRAELVPLFAGELAQVAVEPLRGLERRHQVLASRCPRNFSAESYPVVWPARHGRRQHRSNVGKLDRNPRLGNPAPVPNPDSPSCTAPASPAKHIDARGRAGSLVAGEAVLQLDVAELVNRSDLSEDTSGVGVSKERHQSPR